MAYDDIVSPFVRGMKAACNTHFGVRSVPSRLPNGSPCIRLSTERAPFIMKNHSPTIRESLNRIAVEVSSINASIDYLAAVLLDPKEVRHLKADALETIRQMAAQQKGKKVAK